jgi:hypothetical protein
MRIAILALTAALAGSAQQLGDVRRICISDFNGGVTATHIRDMLVAALQKNTAFVITENPARAEAVLKGSAEDLVFTENFSANDSVTARVAPGSALSKTVGGKIPNISIGEQDSQHTTERKHEAFATVRLVNTDGDVIWSTTQESTGAKFRGASADVAEKVAKQLLSDIEKAKRPPSQ